VPPAANVDSGASAAKAISVDLKSIPGLEDLASRYNSFSSDELLKQMNKVLPGYSETLAKEGADIGGLLKGEVPQDVQDFIGRKAAELGITTGASGGSFTKFGQLRDLGLTSLDAMTKGFDAASRWIASAAKPAMFDFSSMFITPGQQIGLDQWNETQRYGREWLKNQLDAIPPAWQQATDQVLNWAEKSAASYATSSLGGMGGGGGKGGGGGGEGSSAYSAWSGGSGNGGDVSGGGEDWGGF